MNINAQLPQPNPDYDPSKPSTERKGKSGEEKKGGKGKRVSLPAMTISNDTGSCGFPLVTKQGLTPGSSITLVL